MYFTDYVRLSVAKIEEAVATVKKWVAQSFLCLNDDKTWGLLIGSK